MTYTVVYLLQIYFRNFWSLQLASLYIDDGETSGVDDCHTINCYSQFSIEQWPW